MTAYTALIPLAPWEPVAVVAEALASIAAQTLPPEQIVISCDGSPSAELQGLLEQQCAILPLLVVSGLGGEGVGPVLARGLNACSTELILRCDADDVCIPERASLQIQALSDRPAVAAISAAICEFVATASGPKYHAVRHLPVGQLAVRRFSKWRNPLNHPAVLLRRSAVLAVGNYRRAPSFEDYDLWLRLLAAGHELDNLVQVLVMARVNEAHRRRRRGGVYLNQEWRFFWRAGVEGLLPWLQVWLLLALRSPWRLLAADHLDVLIRRGLRRPFR